jgi:hypothetical protein
MELGNDTSESATHRFQLRNKENKGARRIEGKKEWS